MNLPFSLEECPSPCYVIDEAKVIRNLEILRSVSERTGCKILLAQKAFSIYQMYPLIGQYLQGTTASGLYEARLGKEEMGGETHVFAPAYMAHEIDEITEICDHVIFNSLSQLYKWQDKVLAAGKQIGLRINPMCSTQDHAIYDPCSPGSRMGVTADMFPGAEIENVTGLHFHTLCEQNADALLTTLEAVEEQFGQWLPNMQWLNFGGGHHITRDDYDIEALVNAINRMKTKYNLQIYLEPGEAVVLNAGYLVSHVLDVVHNSGIDTAVLDASAACHMPDVLEMPYRPPVLGTVEDEDTFYHYRLAGNTCLAGDIIGDYSFPNLLLRGTPVVFGDMALYTMVKNNTFNGIRLPSIAIAHADGKFEVIKTFGYEDFKSRL